MLFKTTRKKAAAALSAKYAELTKADEADEILNELDLDSWVEIVSAAEAQMEVAGKAGVSRAMGSINFGETEHPKDWQLAQEDAISYATDRAAELVGKKWVRGRLVDNPSAEWTISESTRDALRELVVSALRDGLTARDLSDRILESYTFSEARANAIARTEIIAAQAAGSMAAYRRSGQVQQKRWVLGSEHDIECDCDTNSEEGWIDLDDEFPSGDDAPPAHPNCVCDVEVSFDEADDQAAEE